MLGLFKIRAELDDDKNLVPIFVSKNSPLELFLRKNTKSVHPVLDTVFVNFNGKPLCSIVSSTYSNSKFQNIILCNGTKC